MRDNIHSADLVAAFEHFHRDARAGGAVYNIGGGRACNCSMLEAIELCQRIAGRELDWTLDEHNRIGDHRWWISDLRPFAADYPGWTLTRGLEDILRELHDAERRALAGRELSRRRLARDGPDLADLPR